MHSLYTHSDNGTVDGIRAISLNVNLRFIINSAIDATIK